MSVDMIFRKKEHKCKDRLTQQHRCKWDCTLALFESRTLSES